MIFYFICVGLLQICAMLSESYADAHDKMPVKVEPLPDSFAELGEGPHWDGETQSLYYVDLNNGKLQRYDYKTDKVFKCQIEGKSFASFIVPVEDSPDLFAVGCSRRVELVRWDGKSDSCKVERTLFEVQPGSEFSEVRFNDGKCDPKGRLFAGTMRITDHFEQRHGELFKYEHGKIEVVKKDVGISNGLAWNEEKNKFYFIDTSDYEVKEYNYDFNNGIAENPNVVYDFRNASLLPDGMTIDSDGNIFVATFNGHSIYKINPTSKEILLEIKFPTKQVTSAAFGGPDLDILFVTTAAINDQPLPAGTTYKVTGLESKGLPMYKLQL